MAWRRNGDGQVLWWRDLVGRETGGEQMMVPLKTVGYRWWEAGREGASGTASALWLLKRRGDFRACPSLLTHKGKYDVAPTGIVTPSQPAPVQVALSNFIHSLQRRAATVLCWFCKPASQPASHWHPTALPHSIIGKRTPPFATVRSKTSVAQRNGDPHLRQAERGKSRMSIPSVALD